MIAFLEGTIVDEQEESLVVLASGVGYEIFCSKNTLDAFFGQTSVRAWVFTQVKEDAITLYGFASKVERQVFESLIKVNGVGPKLAIKILSGSRLEKITEMIEQADVSGLMKLPKVGKKTAEQIILTLKGKLTLATDKIPGVVPQGQVREKIVSALTHLGFKPSDVEEAVSTLAVDVSFEDGVREGLATLSGGH